ncbi:MAG: hypothetical protein AAF696_37755, partial [Bacteroidota bacterium]
MLDPKPTGTNGLFAEEFRLTKLSKQGDPLERLNKIVYWGFFRETGEKSLPSEKMANAGPKPYDPLL